MAVAFDRALALQAKLFRGLADPARLALLDALRTGDRTVSELVAATGLSQPNASNHLACLRDCGLVTATQEGRFVRYALAGPRVEAVLRDAEQLLAGMAAEIYACTRYSRAEGDQGVGDGADRR